MVFTPPKMQIPDAWLQLHGADVYQRLVPWLALFEQHKISAAEFSAIYLLFYTTMWRGALWHNGHRIRDELTMTKSKVLLSDLKLHTQPENTENMTVMEFLFNTQLRGVSVRAQRALLQWHAGIYPMQLCFIPPSPSELLAIQARGERVVTLFVTLERMTRRNFSRDPLTFLIHDLEHADEFFYDRESFLEQKMFYAELHQKRHEGYFDVALQDAKFKREFDYVISDMNSHPAHLRATLDFLLRDYESRRSGGG